MCPISGTLKVYRQKKWIRVPTDQLIAGDIVSVSEANQKFPIPADLLLLRGTCIVDESMLTGESVPVSKVRWFSSADVFKFTKFSSVFVLSTFHQFFKLTV